MVKNKKIELVEKFLIITAHLVLLKWIFYALYEGGTLETTQLLLHFFGMALYGAGLIRFCAWLAKRKFLKQNNLEKLDA